MGPAAADAEFVRRVYLDLAGRIPATGEARRFLSDKAGDWRGKLIDQLLAGPDTISDDSVGAFVARPGCDGPSNESGNGMARRSRYHVYGCVESP
ncbi:MAG: DUF1549 domain-containing protein [Planctomycetes bacterium]|nr:DUF1549 domain-containing protein [Planctomycetota bacterium]